MTALPQDTALTTDQRNRALAAMSGDEGLDVLVVGGGVTGQCATRRGQNVQVQVGEDGDQGLARQVHSDDALRIGAHLQGDWGRPVQAVRSVRAMRIPLSTSGVVRRVIEPGEMPTSFMISGRDRRPWRSSARTIARWVSLSPTHGPEPPKSRACGRVSAMPTFCPRCTGPPGGPPPARTGCGSTRPVSIPRRSPPRPGAGSRSTTVRRAPPPSSSDRPCP